MYNMYVSIICTPEMWSETVGLRTRPVWDQKNQSVSVLILVLVLQFWCCFVKHDLLTLVVIMILKDTASFQDLYYVLGTSLLWRSTVAFTYLKIK